MGPRVIALYSPVMQSGKSTTAEYLCSAHGYQLIRFCDPIKAMADILLGYAGLTEDSIWDCLHGKGKEAPLSRVGNRTARHIMQTLGTEWGRDLIHPDLWANIALSRINDSPNLKFVIDDMRFLNEYAAIQKIPGSEAWIVTRPGVEATNSHVSEGQLNAFPFHQRIVNDGTILDLHSKINKIMGMS